MYSLDISLFYVIIKMYMKYKKEQSAIKNLKRIFRNTPESDSILLDDIYPIFGRDLTKAKSNKNWITNVMSHLRYHNLIASTYTYYTGKRVLSGLQLTMKGKKALGRIDTSTKDYDFLGAPNAVYPLSNNNLFKIPDLTEMKMERDLDNVSNILKAIAKLKNDHPEFEIIFDMKLKGV